MIIGVNFPSNYSFSHIGIDNINKLKFSFLVDGEIKNYILEIKGDKGENIIDNINYVPIELKTKVMGYMKSVLLIKSGVISYGNLLENSEFYDEKKSDIKYKCTYE